MIEVRILTSEEHASAIKLKIHCWQEELVVKVEHGENAMEHDGLWGEENHQGNGISLVLLSVLVKAFRDLGKD